MYGQKKPDKKVVNLSAKSYEKEIAEGIVLVEYWAPWCGPCRKLAPILKQISEETVVKVGKLNVDHHKAFVKKQNINIVPTMIIYKDGIEKERLNGSYTKDELMEILNTHIQK